MPSTSYYLTADGELRRDLDADAIAEALKSRKGLLWLDFIDADAGRRPLPGIDLRLPSPGRRGLPEPPPPYAEGRRFRRAPVHPRPRRRPRGPGRRADDGAGGLPRRATSSSPATPAPLYSIEAVRAMVEDDARPMRRGADFLAHAFIDALIDNILPTIDRMTEVAEEVQEEAIHEAAARDARHHPAPQSLLAARPSRDRAAAGDAEPPGAGASSPSSPSRRSSSTATSTTTSSASKTSTRRSATRRTTPSPPTSRPSPSSRTRR